MEAEVSEGELERRMERLGCLPRGMGGACGEREVLYLLVHSRDGRVTVSFRCGGDCVLAPVEDVAYVGRTVQGLKVHVRGASGELTCLTLGSGRKEKEAR